MASLLRFLVASVMVLLPRQYRRRWLWGSDESLRGPAIFSGLAEAGISLLLIIIRFFTFFPWRMGTIADAALKRAAGDAALGSLAVQFGSGFTTLVEYAFRPLTLLLIYFTIEGTVRVFAAWVADECAGTLPLYVIAWGADRARAAWHELQLGPRVPDLVQHCVGISYDLSIASCRSKPGWNHLTTIEYRDEFYELYGQKRSGPPRPYLYQLRKLTPGRVIRGLHHYHPHEALTEKQRAALAKEATAGEGQLHGSARSQR
jgi:hypothetical protein